MLSCRGVKAPLIFVSVLMHRETNLQVENEETIEAQSARTPKRCWTESNSAFSFVCANGLRWCSGRRRRFATASASRLPRASRPPPRSSALLPACRTWRAATRTPFGLTRLARAKSVRYTLLSPTARSAKIGRQFSYKQNAEEGARLDEQRRTKGWGSRGGRGRSFVFGDAWGYPGCCEPSCGGYARSGAFRRDLPARPSCRSLCPHPNPRSPAHERPPFLSCAVGERRRAAPGLRIVP